MICCCFFSLSSFRNLADYDKDGRLSSDEFVIAMHCCDIARTGQPLPTSLPDEWTPKNLIQRDQINSTSKTTTTSNLTYANLNQQLKETINQPNSTTSTEKSSDEITEAEKKITMQTYEEKRQKNYEVYI